MEKEQLKQWVLWTVIVGILGVLLTGPWGFKGMEYMKGVWHKDGMMNGKMMEMMNKGGGMMNEEMMEMMNNGGMTK
ncbi:MAG: hypothetical protein Q8P95_04935 [bacterium]|nr:hypothetical protein [bacterium]